MLASCDNCIFQSEGFCSLGATPKAGELLCEKYSMTLEFRESILDAMRKDIQREIQAAVLKVRVEELEKAQGFAG